MANQLQKVGNLATGGDVVGLLLRQAILRRSIRRGPVAGEPPYVENPMPFIAGIPITTLQQEAYTFDAEVTKHSVESGSVLSDHVILQPVRIDLSFEVSNWEDGFAEYSFDLLEDLWRSRTPVELITAHKRMSDMVITSLQADNSAPQWKKLSCRASFTQLRFITLETIKYPASKVAPSSTTSGPATPKSAETASDNGQQKPKVSALKTLFGSF